MKKNYIKSLSFFIAIICVLITVFCCGFSIENFIAFAETELLIGRGLG